MKHLRRTLALLLCLASACVASAASAAPKSDDDYNEAPNLKFAYVTSGSVESGTLTNVDITASLPGFLNLYLLDQSGSVVLTIAENKEIHSDETSFSFDALDDSGELLPVGVYTVSAEMISQYGVASGTITKDLKISANTYVTPAPTAAKKTAGTASSGKTTASAKNADVEEGAEDEENTVSADTKTAGTASSGETTASAKNTDVEEGAEDEENTVSADTKTAAPRTTPAPIVTDEMQYVEGTYAMGDEGLLVGVGVDDTAAQTDAGYWGLTADASDAEIWAALTRTMTGVDVGENESSYIYNSPDSGRKKLGTVSGLSQGLNVIKTRDDGWSLVEAFRNEDGAFVRGYIKSDKLREVEPNLTYGIVIDKATQTLTVYKDGARLGSCLVSTGLPTPKYPHRETPAGEFILVTRRGSFEYYGMGYTRYTIRVNGSYYLAEVPTTKKNGSKFLDLPDVLGNKATRGNICIAHDASADGGINAEWIWKMTDDNKKVKVLIFDDKERSDVPLSSK